MRTMRAIFLITITLTPNQARGQSSEPLEARAMRAFQEGVKERVQPLLARQHFSAAADLFRQVHESGARSPELYLNLGNAALLADRWPEALWAYQCGLQLDPNDWRLREHRDFVRTKVVYSSSNQGRPRPEFWPAWLYRPPTDWLAGIACSMYALAWVAGTGAFLWNRPRLVKAAALAGLVAFASGACLWHELDQAHFDGENPLVILKENTIFYRGNGASYPPHPEVPSLPRGMEARQQHARGAWLQVRLSTGEIGWLPRDRVFVVEP